MGHSTSSGRTVPASTAERRAALEADLRDQGFQESPFNAAVIRREQAQQSAFAGPRYEMPVDFRSDVPSIVRNLNQRLSITNDTSDMDVVRRGDDEYEVTRQWQESAPNGGYYSRRETTTMNRGQATRAIRREVSERSTVRLGNETLLRYRRNRG